MSSKPKGPRHKYSSETISVIPELKKLGQLHREITHHLEIPKFSVTTILYWETRQSDDPSNPSK